MANPRRRAQTSPTLVAFGRQLRRYREAARLSQESVAKRVGTTGSFVSQVEKGRKRCKRDFAEIADSLLQAGGRLLALYDDLVKDGAPGFVDWFDWPAVEAEAVMIDSWQPMLIHGLVQTRDYASAVFRGNEKQIEARMSRQNVLTREDPPPPIYTLLLEEGALYREVGNPSIMREQLNTLADRVSDRLSVHLIPPRGEHLGNAGSLTLARLEDMSEVGFADTISQGVTTEEPDKLRTIHQALAEIRALALPVAESVRIIRKVAEEKWT